MVSCKRTDIDARSLRSLAWCGESLRDYLGGRVTYHLDGTIEEPTHAWIYAYPFDAVVATERHAVLVDTLGTKALLIDASEPQPRRELNRSFYHARDYEYPVALLALPGGEAAIVHCPDSYDTLEIERVEDHARLTTREGTSADIFHTRLSSTTDGKYLVEQAWVWQPWNVIAAFNVQEALENPNHLDGGGIDIPQGGSLGWEPASLTMSGHVLVFSSILPSSDQHGDEDEEEFTIRPAEPGVQEAPATTSVEKVRVMHGSDVVLVDGAGTPVRPAPGPKRPAGCRVLLQAHDLDTGRLLSTREMPELVGRMMPAGPDHVVSFYDHPKLVEVATGKVVQRWEDLDAGPEREQPSAMMTPPGEPFLALDPARARFAIGTRDRITIIEISP